MSSLHGPERFINRVSCSNLLRSPSNLQINYSKLVQKHIMPLFGRRRNRNTSSLAIGHPHHNRQRGGLFHRKDRDRVAGGFSKCPFPPLHCHVKYSLHSLVEAALANPNTTHGGRNHAKHELHAMVSNHACEFSRKRSTIPTFFS